MIHVRKLWIDLIFNRIQDIVLNIKHLIWKIKDYDRQKKAYENLRNDYIRLTQNGIDLEKLGIIDMIDEGATIEEIKKYLMS